MKRAAIILAAGKSTRMQSVRSKVLHHVGGRAMLDWVTDLARQAGAERIICVVGQDNQDVREAALALGLEIAIQEPQLGTAHAVQCASDALEGFEGHIAVLYADTPLISLNTLNNVFDALAHKDLCVLGFEPEDPGAYGRLIVEGDHLSAIVEAKEASPEQLSVRLCNSGVIACLAHDLFAAIEQVDNDNVKGEYYLTDIVEILNKNSNLAGVVHASETEVMGVNSRVDLALAEKAFQDLMRAKLMAAGVTLRDPDTIYLSWDTKIAQDTEIGAHCVIGPKVTIGRDTIIHPFCHLEGTEIGDKAQIGPFARLRPGTKMHDGSKAGNFVETKKAIIGKGSKINHLSYIGDAKVGAKVNIGAGTITCNYDGYNKHLTQIEDGAFIGTNSSLVAPVKIGRGAYLGSGGVVTKDVPDDALALARAHQINKTGWAARYRRAQDKRKSKS